MAEMLYEGKAKKVFATADPNEVVIYYKDDATALNGAKKGTIVDKGIMNNTITTFFFDLLGKNGIPHHIIKKLSDREQLCKKVKIIPVEVVCRNIAAGSLAKKMGVEEGYVLHRPLVEFYYKSDELDDPMISPDYGVAFGFATDEQIATLREMALKINAVLKDFLASRKVRLIDFKTEYGVDKDGNIILADEITPDTARLWDWDTNEKLDKDRFRRDMGGVEEAYHEIIRRLTGEGK
ncbi:MAG: phosphoribosylaminoimidazolesuccinocarboxamide synthase [Phascolarctobacterium sp.]|nr:MAG: phosphoribosylaminoimidazolesuccinocarboxamide synthase [Phascolarctobacterium sp.]